MASKLFIISFLLFLLTMISATSASHQFKLQWSKPAGNETQTYNGWAQKNRFHVGDTIVFNYQNDSLLVVDRDDYKNCSAANPITTFKDDNSTEFRFDRFGFFYFISGEPEHCKSGQRLIIRVMVHPEVVQAPGIAPAPQGGSGGGIGGDWGPPAVMPNSTVRLPIASYFLTLLGGMMVILYIFM